MKTKLNNLDEIIVKARKAYNLGIIDKYALIAIYRTVIKEADNA